MSGRKGREGEESGGKEEGPALRWHGAPEWLIRPCPPLQFVGPVWSMLSGECIYDPSFVCTREFGVGMRLVASVCPSVCLSAVL